MALIASIGVVRAKFEITYNFPMAIPTAMLTITNTGRNLKS